MKSIVILGAGTGGSIVANILSKKLPKTEFKITVIDRSDTHFYQPGLLFIPFKLYGYEGESDIRRQVSDVLSDRVEFVRADISRIDHENNTVETSAGKFQYDWLVSSLGCQVDAEEVGGC
ncbi:MAG: FAD-dependent oxidoreductase, partial [Gammaproteobacteria bacterium]|nr:FAD-dependent oxidoreductase [Gammaproteobacteria bacterium]